MLLTSSKVPYAYQGSWSDAERVMRRLKLAGPQQRARDVPPPDPSLPWWLEERPASVKTSQCAAVQGVVPTM